MSGSANQHAKYSASKADQWVNCPQSVEYINKLIADGKLPEKQEVKDYTQHGTDAHDYAEAQLLYATGESKVKPDYPKQIIEDREEYLIDSYVNNILDLKGEHTLLVEAEVPLFYSKEETGTVDACVITDDAIHVRDLKWGYTPVSSKFNKQGMIYTRSLIEDIIDDTLQERYDVEINITDDTPITIGIIQPRTGDSNNLHETTWGELKLDTMEIEVVYRNLMLNRPTEFNPTPKGCKWCRANTTDSKGNYLCRARHIKLMGLLPSDINIHNNDVTLEQRLAVSDNRKEIESYLKTNDGDLLAHAETVGIAGYKVGRTRLRDVFTVQNRTFSLGLTVMGLKNRRSQPLNSTPLPRLKGNYPKN